MGRRAELKVALLLAGLAGGCEGCQQEKPYNPFGVTSALSGAETAPPEGSAAALSSAKPEPGKFAPAVVAPAGSRKLRRGELVLEAPARYSFDRALIVGEGEALETVAWVKADPEARDVTPGMLVAFDAQGQRRQLATLPSFVPSAPGCSHTTRLEQTGPRSVLVDTVARCDAPLLAGPEFRTGEYELIFAAGDYLRGQGTKLPEPAFLDSVPIRFGMAATVHYHVPLLISPYGYSTYRGS